MRLAGKHSDHWGWRLLVVPWVALVLLAACVDDPPLPTQMVLMPVDSPTVQATMEATPQATDEVTPAAPTPTPVPPTPTVEVTVDAVAAGFPVNIPIIPGAQVIEASPGRMIYHTQESVEAAIGFYADKLLADGWIMGYQGKLLPGICLGMVCDDGLATGAGQLWTRLGNSLQVLAATEAGRTVITINYFSD